MKKICLYAAMLCAVFWGTFGNAVGSDGEYDSVRGGYRKINASNARTFLRESENVILIDVRTEAEYRKKRIPGAVLLPHNKIAARAALEVPDKNTPILLYCRSGRRSGAAAKALVKKGYTRVYDMGGIIDWPYETEGE